MLLPVRSQSGAIVQVGVAVGVVASIAAGLFTKRLMVVHHRVSLCADSRKHGVGRGAPFVIIRLFALALGSD